MSTIEDVIWFACVWVAWRLLWWIVYNDEPPDEATGVVRSRSTLVVYDPSHYVTDAFAKQLVANWREARTQEARDIAERALEALGLCVFFKPRKSVGLEEWRLMDPTFGDVVDEFDCATIVEEQRVRVLIHTVKLPN